MRRTKVAKGKPAKTNKAQSAASSKGKTSTPKMAGRSAPRKPVAVASPDFTGIAIGHAAGEVWGLLNGGKPRTIAEIKKSVKAPGDVVVAAIGWLAREDKLEFDFSNKTVKIGLR
jgi:hypothetical protein